MSIVAMAICIRLYHAHETSKKGRVPTLVPSLELVSLRYCDVPEHAQSPFAPLASMVLVAMAQNLELLLRHLEV